MFNKKFIMVLGIILVSGNVYASELCEKKYSDIKLKSTKAENIHFMRSMNNIAINKYENYIHKNNDNAPIVMWSDYVFEDKQCKSQVYMEFVENILIDFYYIPIEKKLREIKKQYKQCFNQYDLLKINSNNNEVISNLVNNKRIFEKHQYYGYERTFFDYNCRMTIKIDEEILVYQWFDNKDKTTDIWFHKQNQYRGIYGKE